MAAPNTTDDSPRPPNAKALTPPPPPPQPPELVSKLTPKFLQSETISGVHPLVYGGVMSPELAAFYQALPPWIDANQRAFTLEIYDQMARDPGVYTPLRTWVAQVMADGIDLRPAVDDKDDPNYQASADQCDFAEAYLSALPRSIEDISYEMLTAAACHGAKVAETILRPDDESEKWVVGRIRTKPRLNLGFVVDRYFNLAGFVPRSPLQIMTTQVIGETPADLREAGVIPREKFSLLSWMPQDEDPRGTSLLHPLFSIWWQKQQLIREYIKGLSQFGTPTLIGELGEDPFDAPNVDSLGNATSTTPLSVADKMRNGLMLVRNGAVFVHSNKGKVYTLDVPNVGAQLQTELDRIDKQLEKAITLQVLATAEAKFSTQASAQVHQDTAGTGLRYPRMILANMWNQLLRLVVKQNDGAKAARTVSPYVSLTATEQQDWATELGAVATAYTAGVVKDPQLPKLWERLGLPDVPPEFLQQEAEQKQAAAQAQLEATKAKAVPPGTQPPAKGKAAGGKPATGE